MPFWKKSDDPWDIDPAKAREKRAKQEREPIENPLNTLRDWNEGRKAEAAARQAELEAQPKEGCPWCGREMERGYLQGGRDRITWTPGFLTTKAAWLGPDKAARERRMQVDDEGAALTTYKTAWYCQDCEKMVIDAAGMRLLNAPYTWPEYSAPFGEEGTEDSGEEGGAP